MKTDEYREICNLLPPVDGLMEKLQPMYLNGRTLFSGLGRVKHRMILRATGINFRRYSSYMLDLLSTLLVNLKMYSPDMDFPDKTGHSVNTFLQLRQ